MIPARDRREARDDFELRLGARLREAGYIDGDNLEEAVRQQVIMGGHLGTNLWELGLVDGRTLSRVSAEILRVPEADPAELAELSGDILAILPQDFVRRSRVLPLGVNRRTLRVATSEPWDHLVLGEAAFLSTYPVEPNFVAEVPLMHLLCTHYDIPMRARFSQSSAPGDPAQERPWHQRSELSADIATGVAASGRLVKPPVIQPSEPIPDDAEQLEPIDTLAEARAALERAHDRNAVGAVLLRFALSRGERVVLLTHRHGQWSGWLGAGGVDVHAVRGLLLEAEPGTAFGLVSRTGAHYMGPLKAHPVHQHFLQVLGDVVPGGIALLPVHFRGKLVLGIYLDAGSRRDVATDLAELLVLAQQTPAALDRLIASRIGTRS
jgi:hypothetical protein